MMIHRLSVKIEVRRPLARGSTPIAQKDQNFRGKSMPELNLESFSLSNGMQVLLHRQPTVHRVSILLNIRSGSTDERLFGTAHMLEHLMFRGTKSLPSFGAISEAFELYGADFNAFTAREVTGFDIGLPAESLAPVLALLGDVMCHAKLTGIAGERNIIREEILADYDDDGSLINVDDLLVSLFYGDAGHPIAGNIEDLEKISSKEVRAFYEAHYAADNMLLVCTGALPPTETLKTMAESALSCIPPQSHRWERRKMPSLYADQASKPTPRLHIKAYDGATQSDLSLGFLFGSPNSPQLPTLECLVRILDDGMASRLTRKLVEDLAIVYDVEAYLTSLQDTTLLQIRTSCRHKRVLRVIEAIYDILTDIAQNGVTTAELARIKKRIVWEHEDLCDGVTRLSQWLSTMQLQGLDCDIETRCKTLCAVECEAIRQLAQNALESLPHIVAIVGDIGEKLAADIQKGIQEKTKRVFDLTYDASEKEDEN